MMLPEVVNFGGFKALCYYNPLLFHFDQTANEEVHCGGFLCRLYDHDDLSCSNCLREFDLGVGFEIPDASDESLRDGVCAYINDHSADLHGESSLHEPDAAITFGPQI